MGIPPGVLWTINNAGGLPEGGTEIGPFAFPLTPGSVIVVGVWSGPTGAVSWSDRAGNTYIIVPAPPVAGVAEYQPVVQFVSVSLYYALNNSNAAGNVIELDAPIGGYGAFAAELVPTVPGARVVGLQTCACRTGPEFTSGGNTASATINTQYFGELLVGIHGQYPGDPRVGVGLNCIPEFLATVPQQACMLLSTSGPPGPTAMSWRGEGGSPFANVIAAFYFTPPLPPGGPYTPVGDIVTDLCVRAGLQPSQVDTSLLTMNFGSPAASLVFPTNIVDGYIVERMMTAAAAIKELMVAYFFGACESDGVLKFIPRTFLTDGPGSPAAPFMIAESDLGIAADKGKLEESFLQEQDLPLSVTVLYNDIALNWQQGKQVRQRNARTVTARNQQLLSIPLSLTNDEAIRIAEATLYSAWQQRQSFTFNLWKALYMLLDPTDIVYLEYEGRQFEVRLINNTLGQGFVVAVKAVSEDVRNYGALTAGVSGGSFVPAQPIPATPTFLFLLDISLLRDVDANPPGSGFYAVLGSSATPSPGAVLYQSQDGSEFTPIASSKVPASFGYAMNALGAPVTPWGWDTLNTLTVKLVTGTLAGTSDANLLAGANALVVGDEVLQFANAVQNTDGTWTISRLLRGRRGTDYFCYGHAAGELAVQPEAGGVLRVDAPLAQIGQLYHYRGVTVGQDPGSASNVDLTLEGRDRKPYSPVAIRGALDTDNNWVMAWIRRTRYGGAYGTGGEALVDGVGGPVNEQAEAYQVDILGGSPLAVLRTLSVYTPYAIYTADMQIEDFGAVQTSLEVDVYQMSAAVGRGWPGMAVLPASSDAPVVPPDPTIPTTGQFYIN